MSRCQSVHCRTFDALIFRPLDGAAVLDNIPKNISLSVLFFFSFSPLSFLSVIINNSSLFLDAKTTTNRTTAQIMYSVKSSLSGGGGEGTAKMCTGVRQESTPTGRGSMSLGSVAGRKENKRQRERIKKKGGRYSL